ncbi:glycoside hydrolase domain-containing protein [Alkalihalobacillus sp. 1P02AB]|uniref:glycoside hydrolase domain-containing protein n=1 Tax=Alkalihalobacillus sp. 1P02AB TaxID=3132260 RepID=UPI0039A62271
MKNKKGFLLSFVAFFAILTVFGFIFFVQSTHSNTDTQGNEEASTNENIKISNNIQNSVSSDSEVEIENSITNNAEEGEVDIENEVINDINDSGSATLRNEIENFLTENLTGSLNNSIENILNGDGNYDVENNINNDINVNINVQVNNEVNNQLENNEESNHNEDSDNQDESDNGKEEGNGNELVWGIDSASETTEPFYACVQENFGDPQVVGRYLGDKEGVSYGLTDEQVELIHSNDAQILLIYNQFEDATGYDNGVAQAQGAIELANEIGAPDGVAIFANIEPIYPVDAAFLEGWYDEISASSYEPAIYGIFASDETLTAAFNEAVENNSTILADTFLWSAAPNIGITTEENAPEFDVEAPEDSLSYGWQYGIDAETCNIDTNLFQSELTDALW